MANDTFKVITVLKDENHPINNNSTVLSAQEFKNSGKTISSVEGFQSRYCYCAKINQFTDKVENPTLTVLGDEYFHLEDSKGIPVK